MKQTKFTAFQKPRRKHFPAFRNDIATELRAVKTKLYREPPGVERTITLGVLHGLKIALRIWHRNTTATQQSLWSDAAGTYAHDPTLEKLRDEASLQAIKDEVNAESSTTYCPPHH